LRGSLDFHFVHHHDLPMIHEEQARQLCAIHTVNNLLQLRGDCDHNSGTDGDSHEHDEREAEGCSTTDGCSQKMATSIMHEWTCHGRVLRRYEQKSRSDAPSTAEISEPSNNNGDLELDANAEKRPKRPWRVATQKEFDDIAKELTLREQMLMEGDESAFLSTTSSKEEEKTSVTSKGRLNKVSMMQRLRSQHGTPYMGNYSFEVIEEALERRGVKLDFYRVPNDGNTTIQNNDDTGEEGGACDGDASSSAGNFLIGFVIYEKEENQRSALSLVTRIGSYIPIIKYFCGAGQHWYAITGVRYSQHQYQSDPGIKYNSGKDTSHPLWSLIDSKMDGIPAIHTEKDLMHYARVVQQRGGLIFRAFVSFNVDRNRL